MRLSLKLSLFIATGILAVLGCDGYLRVHRELRRFAERQQRDQRMLAHVLSMAASAASDRAGPQRALQLLRDVNLRERDVDIRWEADPLRSLRRTTSLVIEDGASRGRTLVTRMPLALDRPGQLVLRQSLYPDDQYTTNTAFGAVRVSALLIALSTAIIFAVGWWLLGVPLRLLVWGARRIGAGELDTRIALARRDEIGELAREMNLMCQQLAASREQAIDQAAQRVSALERMAQAERWTTLGKLALGLSHALGERARDIRERAESLLKAPDAPEPLRAIAQQARQLTDVLDAVSEYAGSARELRQTHDLALSVRAAVELVAHAAEQQRVRIEIESDADPVQLLARASQLEQLAINLLLNAIQAQPDGGRVRIAAHRDCRAFVRDGLKIGASDYACLVVEDEGAGMSQETRERMFEPLFTTRHAEQASGLGLAAVAAIVAEHRGFVDVASGPGMGTRIAVFLRAS
jgi:two-component system NtrC family sensor kinase